MSAHEAEPTDNPPLPTRAQFDRLVRDANEGQPGALDRLRRCLDEHPEIWRQTGDLAALAAEGLIALTANRDVLISESVRRRLGEMSRELLGESPSRIERMAVERITLAWLEASYLSNQYQGTAGATLAQQKAISEAKAAADRRLEAAMKSLLTLRSLATRSRTIGPERLRVVG